MYSISKELLSEVLGKEIKHYTMRGNNIICFSQNRTYKDADNVENPINIHELSHKCKERAYEQGYIIETGVYPTTGLEKREYFYTIRILHKANSLPTSTVLETLYTEPEAVFKAYQLILDNKGADDV
jgi:hypothetical protein